MPVRFYKVYDFAIHGNEPQEHNSVRTIGLDGKLICLAFFESHYYALDDRCPHAGGRLGLGKCNVEGKVVCPIHRYQFDLKTGRGLPQQGDYVNTYPVEIKSDGVYIGLNKKWWQF